MSTDLTIEQIGVLETARVEAGITRRNLLDLGMAYGQTCTVVRRLEELGLLRNTGRRRSGARIFHLTPAGVEALAGKLV